MNLSQFECHTGVFVTAQLREREREERGERRDERRERRGRGRGGGRGRGKGRAPCHNYIVGSYSQQ